MRREVILCDRCKKEHDAQYELPAEWLRVKRGSSYFGTEEELHFCSLSCLEMWVVGEQIGARKEAVKEP